VLRDDENLPFVYLAQPDGSFARRHVTLGYRDNQNYDVTSGLQGGERVVANGAIFLQFMQSQ
jgi:cobalt-zinc-cadmium efflux system membrane fusion protein